MFDAIDNEVAHLVARLDIGEHLARELALVVRLKNYFTAVATFKIKKHEATVLCAMTRARDTDAVKMVGRKTFAIGYEVVWLLGYKVLMF